MDKEFDNSAFKELRQYLGLTQDGFADIVGSSQQVITMIENNRRGIPSSIREGFLKHYKIELQEAMKKENYNKIKQINEAGSNSFVGFGKDDLQIVKIPFYREAKAAAGLGEVIPENSEQDFLFFDKRWVENILGADVRMTIAITAKGNSMDGGVHPIKNGDLLFVDTSVKNIVNNKVFVIQQENELRVKRVVKDFSGVTHLISDNPDKSKYPDEVINKDSLIVGRVVWNGSKENI